MFQKKTNGEKEKMSEDLNYWTRLCKTEGCQTLAHPTSDYCKECREERKKTMSDVYDDGSDHIVCEKCGYCIKCGDCKEFGCGSPKDECEADRCVACSKVNCGARS